MTDQIDFDLKMTSLDEAGENIYWLALRGVRLDLEGDKLKMRGPDEWITPTVQKILVANRDLVKEALTRFYHTRWVEPCWLEEPYMWPNGAWPVTLYHDAGKCPVMFWDVPQLIKVVKNPAATPTQGQLLTAPAAGASYYSG